VGADAPKTVVHVAVSNPIWVDCGGNGYRPTPPTFGNTEVVLGEQDNTGAMRELAPISAAADAKPGRILMMAKNRGEAEAKGEVVMQVRPAGAIRFLNPEEKRFQETIAPYQGKPFQVDAILVANNRVAYALAPKQEIALAYEVALAEGYTPGGVFFYVPRDEDLKRNLVGYFFEISGYTCPFLPKLTATKAVAESLAKARAYTVKGPDGARLAEVRFAATASTLALDIQVQDAGLRPGGDQGEGSRVVVYATDQEKERLEHYDAMYRIPRPLAIYAARLLPPAGAQAASGQLLSAPDVKVPLVAAPAEGGYRLQALLSLRELHIAQAAKAQPFLVEVEVVTFTADGQERRGTLFGSLDPAADNTWFGRIHPQKD